MYRIVSFGIIMVSLSSDCSDSESQVRADGLAVECEPAPDAGDDDVYLCVPSDGDDACESAQEGGAALVLWPPNHKMHVVSMDDCAIPVANCEADDDEEAPLPWSISAVTSDEALDVGRGGDGHTPEGDIVITSATTVELRAERQGGGDGRVYLIHLSNERGDTAVCEVDVPHDQGPHGGAIDSGEAVRVLP